MTMINADRIVPIQVIDLISMYGLILKQDATNNSSLAKVSAGDIGVFSIESASTPLIAAEPVKTCDIASGVSSATVYFVPAYDYAGFTIGGASATVTGNVDADSRTLYKAVLSSGSITITKVGF